MTGDALIIDKYDIYLVVAPLDVNIDTEIVENRAFL